MSGSTEDTVIEEPRLLPYGGSGLPLILGALGDQRADGKRLERWTGAPGQFTFHSPRFSPWWHLTAKDTAKWSLSVAWKGAENMDIGEHQQPLLQEPVSSLDCLFHSFCTEGHIIHYFWALWCALRAIALHPPSISWKHLFWFALVVVPSACMEEHNEKYLYEIHCYIYWEDVIKGRNFRSYYE